VIYGIPKKEVKNMVKKKRKAPKISKEGIEKLLANPKTPEQLKPYWRKRLKAMK